MGLLELAPPALRLKPEDALQRFGILAMSGAGKSNTAVVLAEELYENFVPWVAIDPKGDWWGIRSSSDGKGPGLAIPVFGGLHGDVPLDETSGKLLAELIAKERVTCVIDVSEFPSKAAQLRFLTDFAETLLKVNRDPLMVFCEEADDYLPQRVQKSETRCVGAWTKLVKRGRFRGIFCTLISQRSAALSKDALNMVDTLIPMRTAAPRDKKAIEEWVISHGKGRELVDSLPELDDGEAWFWSPHKLGMMERLRFRRRQTFDSGETPTLKGSRPPAKLADVDLSAIQTQMAEAFEQAKKDDPKLLRDEIARLRKELAAAKDTQAEPEEVEVEVPVEVPVFPGELKIEIENLLDSHADSAGSLLTRIQNGEFDLSQKKIGGPQKPAPKSQRASGVPKREPDEPPGHDERPTGRPVELPTAAAKMLVTLVQRHPMKLSRSQLAALSGYSVKSSTVSVSLTKLRNEGCIEEGDGLIWPSDLGFKVVGAPPEPMTSAELIESWRSSLTAGARAFFNVLVEVYPERLNREELADRAGYSISSSTVSVSLTTLRRNGLLDESGNTISLIGDLFS